MEGVTCQHPVQNLMLSDLGEGRLGMVCTDCGEDNPEAIFAEWPEDE